MTSQHRIKEVRESLRENGKKVSGIAVAKKLGITPQYYYDIERGDRNLSAEMAAQLSDMFGCSVDYLLGRDEKGPTPVGIEPSDLAIEDLLSLNLTYKGQKLTESQKQQFVKLARAAADLMGQ